MFDELSSELLRIFINILGQEQGNHEPDIIRDQEYIAMVVVGLKESIKEVMVLVSVRNSHIICGCILVA